MESPILTNPTEAELVRAIGEHMPQLFESMAVIPGAAFHRSPELSWFTTPVVSPMFAGVYRNNLAETDVDETIVRVTDELRESGTQYAFWWIGPNSRPADLGSRLAAHGLAPWDMKAPGMAVEIARLSNPVPPPSGFRTVEVTTESALKDWKTGFVAGMEVPEFAGRAWVDASLRIGLGQLPWRMLVGYLDSEPVAVAGVYGAGGVAALFAIATVPNARGQGIAGALTVSGLQLMEAAGYRWGVLFSSPMGVPVYERLGFRTYCSISRYLWRAASNEL